MGAAVAQKSFDVNLVNPFIDATMKVLKIQSQTNVTPGKIFIRQGDKPSGDVSGVIGLVSPGFNGSIVISFPEKTFLAIMSKMLGETLTSLTKEINDGAGEISNMIFGQAKTELNKAGYGIQMALPTVIVGKDHTFLNSKQGPSVIVPFNSDCGEFYVEICVA